MLPFVFISVTNLSLLKTGGINGFFYYKTFKEQTSSIYFQQLGHLTFPQSLSSVRELLLFKK